MIFSQNNVIIYQKGVVCYEEKEYFESYQVLFGR